MAASGGDGSGDEEEVPHFSSEEQRAQHLRNLEIEDRLREIQKRNLHPRSPQVLQALLAIFDDGLQEPPTVASIARRADLGPRLTKHCLEGMMERGIIEKVGPGPEWAPKESQSVAEMAALCRPQLRLAPNEILGLKTLYELSGGTPGRLIQFRRLKREAEVTDYPATVSNLQSYGLAVVVGHDALALTEFGAVEYEGLLPDFEDFLADAQGVEIVPTQAQMTLPPIRNLDDIPAGLLQAFRQLLQLKWSSFNTTNLAGMTGMEAAAIEQGWLWRMAEGRLVTCSEGGEWSFTDRGRAFLKWRHSSSGGLEAKSPTPARGAGIRYQVFLSSTFNDLKTEREQLIWVLQTGNIFIPTGMEMFTSRDERGWEIITRTIDDSDYYVLVVGGKYGTEDGDLSWTEKEYQFAIAKGLPVFAFIRDPDSIVGEKNVEQDPAKKAKLEEFKAKLRDRHLTTIKNWKTADELSLQISQALFYELLNGPPARGWIRGPALPEAREGDERSVAVEPSPGVESRPDIDIVNTTRLETIRKLRAYFRNLAAACNPGQEVERTHAAIASEVDASPDDIFAWLPDVLLELMDQGWTDIVPGESWVKARTPR